MATPRLTHHARQRCAEMGIGTRVAKRIVQQADCRRPSRDGATVATCEAYPEYAVVFEAGEPNVIITVVFRTTEAYVREGATFRAA